MGLGKAMTEHESPTLTLYDYPKTFGKDSPPQTEDI